MNIEKKNICLLYRMASNNNNNNINIIPNDDDNNDDNYYMREYLTNELANENYKQYPNGVTPSGVNVIPGKESGGGRKYKYKKSRKSRKTRKSRKSRKSRKTRKSRR